MIYFSYRGGRKEKDKDKNEDKNRKGEMR